MMKITLRKQIETTSKLQLNEKGNFNNVKTFATDNLLLLLLLEMVTDHDLKRC